VGPLLPRGTKSAIVSDAVAGQLGFVRRDEGELKNMDVTLAIFFDG